MATKRKSNVLKSADLPDEVPHTVYGQLENCSSDDFVCYYEDAGSLDPDEDVYIYKLVSKAKVVKPAPSIRVTNKIEV